MEVPQARDTISQHQQLIRCFRKSRLPIVYTRFLAGDRKLLWEFSPRLLRHPHSHAMVATQRLYGDVHKTLDSSPPLSTSSRHKPMTSSSTSLATAHSMDEVGRAATWDGHRVFIRHWHGDTNLC